MKANPYTLENMPDRELIAASETLSALTFSSLALDGLCQATRARLESRHWVQLVLLSAYTGVPWIELSNRDKVNGELAFRASLVLRRFGVKSAGPYG